jgi:hypothetical protein
MKPKDLPLFRNKEAKQVLEKACLENGITISLLHDLLEAQRKYAGSGRAVGITADYESCIGDFLETQLVREAS